MSSMPPTGDGDGDATNIVAMAAAGSEVAEVQDDGADSHIRYDMPPEDDNAGFSTFHMVWGKINNYPWWPGQIFDPMYASDMASNHQERDQFLVAFFGLGTFAWCKASQLKPFGSFFAQMEKQSHSEAFMNAVKVAVKEWSRRAELGMSCRCMPGKILANLKHREVNNVGIRKGTLASSAADKDFAANSFQPKRLLEYVGRLARNPLARLNRLERKTATKQVRALYRLYQAKLPSYDVVRKLKTRKIEDVLKDAKVVDDDEDEERSRKKRLRMKERTATNDDDDLLPQLCLLARAPMKGYGFMPTVTDFFTRYRDACVTDGGSSAAGGKRVGKKKAMDSPKEDSYWDDL